MKCDVWKPCSDRTSFDFQFEDFFEQLAVVNNHLLCYWPTIYNLISKICPKFQVHCSHFFEVDELLDEHWAKLVRSGNMATPIYVECDKIYQSKVWLKNSGISCLALIFNLSYPRSTMLHPKNRLGNMKSHIPCFFVKWIRIYGWVVKDGRR